MKLKVGDTVKYLCGDKRGTYVILTENNVNQYQSLNNKFVVKVQGIPNNG